MTDDQIKIADDLLEYLKSHRGYSSIDDYPAFMSKKLHLEMEVTIVKKMLISMDLLTQTESKYLLTLTPEGHKAAKIGFTSYLINEEKKDRDRDAKDHRDAVMSKWQIVTFWPLFIFATIGTISGIISLIWLIIGR